MQIKLKPGELYRTKNGFPVKVVDFQWNWQEGWLPKREAFCLLGYEPGIALACWYKADGTPVHVSTVTDTVGFEITSKILRLQALDGGKDEIPKSPA
jgi:hypothetical protein